MFQIFIQLVTVVEGVSLTSGMENLSSSLEMLLGYSPTSGGSEVDHPCLTQYSKLFDLFFPLLSLYSCMHTHEKMWFLKTF